MGDAVPADEPPLTSLFVIVADGEVTKAQPEPEGEDR